MTATTLTETIGKIYSLVVGMEEPSTIIQDMAVTLAILCETEDTELTRCVQRLAFITNDNAKAIEKLRGHIFHLAHTRQAFVERTGANKGDEASSDKLLATAFQELEGTIHDARNMADLTRNLIEEFQKERSGEMFLITSDDMRNITFSIYQTSKLVTRVLDQWQADFRKAGGDAS